LTTESVTRRFVGDKEGVQKDENQKSIDDSYSPNDAKGQTHTLSQKSPAFQKCRAVGR